MLYYKTIICILFFPILFLGCNEETCCDNPEEIIAFEAPLDQDFENLINSACNLLIQEHTFMAEQGTLFTSIAGAQIEIIGEQCFIDANGVPITGEITLQFIEIYNRETMLPCDKTTLGLNPEGNKQLLTTAGIFYVNFLYNGENIPHTCQAFIIVPNSQTGGQQLNMDYWEGIVDSNRNLFWTLAPDAFVESNETSYFTQIKTGWFGLAQFFESNLPQTTIKALVTQGYHFNNASVYLSYAGQKHGLAHFDSFQEETNFFSEHYGKVFTGATAHIIFVTEDNNSWRYAIKTITVEEDHLVTFIHSETQITTLENLKTLLSNLP